MGTPNGNSKKNDSGGEVAGREIGQVRVRLPTPTPDQKDFLEGVRKSSEEYDPEIVVGGPRRRRP